MNKESIIYKKHNSFFNFRDNENIKNHKDFIKKMITNCTSKRVIKIVSSQLCQFTDIC